MSIRNPNNNQEPTPDSGRTDDASNVSPEPSGPRNFVNIEPADDLRGARIERLGQYLSDTTMGNLTDDVRNPARNFFPISAEPVEATTTVENQSRGGQDRYTDFIAIAKKEFEELSQSSAFSAENFDPSFQDRPRGHYILEGGPAQSATQATQNLAGGQRYVNQEIKDAVSGGGRWGGVGRNRFAHGSPSGSKDVDEHTHETNQNPYWKQAPHSPSQLPDIMQTHIVDGSPIAVQGATSESQHSSYQTYSHKATFPEESSRYAGDFWHKYFERMSRVGAAITVKATGRDTATTGGNFDDFFTRNLERMKIFGNVIGGSDDGGGSAIFLAGLHDEPHLGGIWSKKNVDDLYAGYAFLAGDEDTFQDNDQMEERYGKAGHTHGGSRNARSWGSTYAYDDPFDNEGIPIIEGRQLSVVLELAQVYFSMVLRAGLLGLFLEFSKHIDGGAAKEAGLEGATVAGGKSGFYMNIFTPPQSTSPLNLDKGSSRYNQKLTTRMLHDFEHAAVNEFGPTKDIGSLDRSIRNLVSGGLFQGTAIIQDEFINFPRMLLKEIGLYIPRHLLSLFNRNRTTVMGKSVGGQVATAYLQATASGLGHVGATILGGDFGMSIGFYRALFKELARSRAEFVSRSHMESIYKTMIDYLGKDDKNMGFMNYLARVGDLVAAQGIVGPLSFPYANVPINDVGDHPSLRMARYRTKGKKTSSTSLVSHPSLNLLPSWITKPGHQDGADLKDNGLTVGEEMAIASGRGTTGHTVGQKFPTSALNNFHNNVELSEDEKKLISHKYQTPANGANRFSSEQVRLMEDQLEAEYMPFYIQDLRTNEIISFAAFITGLSDSFTGEWSGSKGFGRLEEVLTYGGASRSMSVDFTMVATSKADFDDLWWKANKLVTLVYPQWSRGTMMTDGTNKWVQPFSQVMTASPLCRLRVGDLFTSNYSKESMARMMGADDPNFHWQDIEGFEMSSASSPSGSEQKIPYITGRSYLELLKDFTDNEGNGYTYADFKVAKEKVGANPSRLYPVSITAGGLGAMVVSVDDGDMDFTSDALSRAGGTSALNTIGESGFAVEPEWLESNIIRRRIVANEGEGTGAAPGFFQTIFTNKNPIIKSFESTMGRGIAVAIDSLGFAFKYGEFPWELEPGNRAPRWIDVKLGFKPIHDITPGIDHNGFNRAPVYKVGEPSKSISGDVWHSPDDYDRIMDKAREGHDQAIDGVDTKWNKTPDAGPDNHH